MKLLKFVWLTLSVCITFLSLANGVNASEPSHKQESIFASTLISPALLIAEELLDDESKQQAKFFLIDGLLIESFKLNNCVIGNSSSPITERNSLLFVAKPFYIQYRKLLI